MRRQFCEAETEEDLKSFEKKRNKQQKKSPEQR